MFQARPEVSAFGPARFAPPCAAHGDTARPEALAGESIGKRQPGGVVRSEQPKARGRSQPERTWCVREDWRRLRTPGCDAYRHGSYREW